MSGSGSGSGPNADKPRFGSLRDLQNQASSGGGGGGIGGKPLSDNDDGEVGNEYFAGGGKNSGISIQDPSKKNKNPASELIHDILTKAKENAPFQGDEDDENEGDYETGTSSRGPAVSSFAGTGYRLGSEDDAPAVRDNQSSSRVASGEAASPPNKKEKLETVTRTLHFWRNGFSIDDGELKSYDDPANQEFLKAVKSGRAPIHLLNVKFGQPVELKVAQKFEEDYKPPPMKAFSGAGNRLGSIIPGETTSAPPAAVPGAFPSSASKPPTAATSGAASGIAPPQVEVDHSQPITTLQIRLGDGTRLVSKFNHSHTLADVRQFIDAAQPNQTRSWVLQTTFPNKEITDTTLTLKDAKLLNAVVLQKYV